MIIETYYTKERLATMLIKSDQDAAKQKLKEPLPNAGKKSPKDIAEASLKVLGLKGLK